ncbi:MAG: hypothetical protein ACQETH_08245 [Candidatus Rifleibacteriota bacterium]
MGALSTFKVMKMEDYDSDIVTFRTSKVCSVLGGLFILAGSGIMIQILVRKLFFTLFSFCLFCSVVSVAFMMAGIILFSYKKYVTMDTRDKKFTLKETSIHGIRNSAFHFDEIMSIELTRDSECVLANHASLWVVKVYLQHEGFAVEKIFATINPLEGKHAAETIAEACDKEMVISCQPNEKLLFSRVIS